MNEKYIFKAYQERIVYVLVDKFYKERWFLNSQYFSKKRIFGS